MFYELIHKNAPDSTVDFQKATEKLKKYNQGMGLLNQDFSKFCANQNYIEPFNKLRIQNSEFLHCEFKSSFVRTNISGSRFLDCNMINTKIENSNFQFSHLERCQFFLCEMSGSNFSNCFLDRVDFEKNTFMGSSFLRTNFKNCSIKGDEFLSSSFEFAKFIDTSFEDIRMANLSMEYAEFINVHMSKVVLPFAQLPFIFNGLDYIMSTKDEISISANMGNQKSISVEEYLETFGDWKIFFYYREMYFPLANILLAQGEKEKALEVILTGIYAMINHLDFRMLKYLCKLAAMNPKVSKEECQMLYKRIDEITLAMIDREQQQYDYELHMNDVKTILLENPKGEPRLVLSLHTNIASSDKENLYKTISVIETIICEKIFGLKIETISLKHNSPYEIILLVIGSLAILNQTTSLIKNIVENVKVSTEDIQSIRASYKYKRKMDQLDLELKQAALRKEKLEAEKISMEIQNFQAEMAEKSIQMRITHNIREKDKIYIA